MSVPDEVISKLCCVHYIKYLHFFNKIIIIKQILFLTTDIKK